MVSLADFGLVFVAGFVTALATGVGALPFFLFDDISDRWNIGLWGLASGIMVAASVFGLLFEGVSRADGSREFLIIVGGIVVGIILVIVGHKLAKTATINPKKYEAADARKLLLILGVLTVHSFPEGVAVGVAFADLNLIGVSGIGILGFSIPLLAVFMTIAISIHNIPEGVAISIPLRAMGVSEWRMVWWSVFSSLPQPIGAVIAFYFVRAAREFLPFGFGFAAGAMVYLVLTEFVPEALALGEEVPGGGRRELVSGMVAGVLLMAPLAVI